MNNTDKIKLYFDRDMRSNYCTFNLKGEFILHSTVRQAVQLVDQQLIWIYSTQTKNETWKCKKFYKIPDDFEDFELISISKYDKVYLTSNNCIYELDILTEKSVRIFGDNKNKV
jgi:hypothetical protein